jgi:hypothetical protein
MDPAVPVEASGMVCIESSGLAISSRYLAGLYPLIRDFTLSLSLPVLKKIPATFSHGRVDNVEEGSTTSLLLIPVQQMECLTTLRFAPWKRYHRKED